MELTNKLKKRANYFKAILEPTIAKITANEDSIKVNNISSSAKKEFESFVSNDFKLTQALIVKQEQISLKLFA